jgi:alpha-beta hydrolase superfamily lysophospholipase
MKAKKAARAVLDLAKKTPRRLASRWRKQMESWRDALRQSGVRQEDLPELYLNGPDFKEQAIVLLHGLGESPRAMTSLAQFYHQNGNHVLNALLEGHGRKPESLSKVTLHDWRRSVDHSMEFASQLGGQIILVGHGLGASLAVDAMRRDPSRVAALMLFSPALKPSEKFERCLQNRWDEGRTWFWARDLDRTHPVSYANIPMNAYRGYLWLSHLLEKDMRADLEFTRQKAWAGPVSVVTSDLDWVGDKGSLELFSSHYRATLFGYPEAARLTHPNLPLEGLERPGLQKAMARAYAKIMRGIYGEDLSAKVAVRPPPSSTKKLRA